MPLAHIFGLIFQSTLPLRGVTPRKTRKTATTGKFQSTLPLRGVTERNWMRSLAEYISIHTPLAGSDARIHENKTLQD